MFPPLCCAGVVAFLCSPAASFVTGDRCTCAANNLGVCDNKTCRSSTHIPDGVSYACQGKSSPWMAQRSPMVTTIDCWCKVCFKRSSPEKERHAHLTALRIVCKPVAVDRKSASLEVLSAWFLIYIVNKRPSSGLLQPSNATATPTRTAASHTNRMHASNRNLGANRAQTMR